MVSLKFQTLYLSVVPLSFSSFQQVVPGGADKVLAEALAMSEKIASFSHPSVAMCKEAVNAAYELSLAEGLRLERRLFHSCFATVSWLRG